MLSFFAKVYGERVWLWRPPDSLLWSGVGRLAVSLLFTRPASQVTSAHLAFTFTSNDEIKLSQVFLVEVPAFMLYAAPSHSLVDNGSVHIQELSTTLEQCPCGRFVAWLSGLVSPAWSLLFIMTRCSDKEVPNPTSRHAHCGDTILKDVSGKVSQARSRYLAIESIRSH